MVILEFYGFFFNCIERINYLDIIGLSLNIDFNLLVFEYGKWYFFLLCLCFLVYKMRKIKFNL